jgi:hypothetical protein
MKKSRIFMIAGSFALVVSAVFATKANKKFAGAVTTAYYQTGGSNYHVVFTGEFTTVLTQSSTSIPAVMKSSASSTARTLFYNYGTNEYAPAFVAFP